MGTQENKAHARRFLEEVINRGNVAVLDEDSSPNFVDHTAPPGVPATNEGFKMFITAFRTAFPDLHYTIDDEIAEGDKVVQRTTARGTMKGDFQGMPASGKTATGRRSTSSGSRTARPSNTGEWSTRWACSRSSVSSRPRASQRGPP